MIPELLDIVGEVQGGDVGPWSLRAIPELLDLVRAVRGGDGPVRAGFPQSLWSRTNNEQ